MPKSEMKHPGKQASTGAYGTAIRSESNGEVSDRPEAAAVPAGVAGLGLMGTSIIAALLSAGHRVTGLTRSLAKRGNSREIVLERLVEMKESGILRADPSVLIDRLRITEDYADLAGCRVVIESIIEDLPAKKEALAKIETVVAADALIGSNTSAIPVSILQAGTLHPERILGIHWAEPAHVTRFMEIICGDRTTPEYAAWAVRLARAWGKEPTLVRRDIRGFITNRLMYAMMREAFYLVENGYATPADVDRSARNDMGFWMTLAGPFRFMDLTGIPAYRSVMKDLFPELCNSAEVPKLMREVVDSGACGVSNARGFYSYTPEQAKRWEALFLKFTYDIRALALRYPEDVGD
jgi:3-hydroxybutyryl-CoA dehydrogenase